MVWSWSEDTERDEEGTYHSSILHPSRHILITSATPSNHGAESRRDKTSHTDGEDRTARGSTRSTDRETNWAGEEDSGD